MKPVLRSLCALMLLTATAAAQDEAPAKPESVKQRASYQIGRNIGENMKSQGLDIDAAMLARGITEALAGKKSALSEDEIREAFSAFQAQMQAKKNAGGQANLEAGKKFLAENAEKEGVKVTKSGLQYKVLREGEGERPKATSRVTTHYRGRLITGEVFDQSYDGDTPTAADEPISFGLNQVIKGWTEGLQLMNKGARYRLFIPSELAYGENGPPSIGSNSTLVFDIELVDFK